MEMTKELIKQELDKLIGTEVYYSPYPIFEVLEKVLQDNNYPVEHLNWRGSRQEIMITWRDYMICCIDYKKKMGPKKQHYWETQKYTYKEFTVSLPWEKKNLNEAISDAVENYRKDMEKQQKELERDKEAFKLLKEHFKLETDWDVRKLVNSINRNYYGITKE